MTDGVMTNADIANGNMPPAGGGAGATMTPTQFQAPSAPPAPPAPAYVPPQAPPVPVYAPPAPTPAQFAPPAPASGMQVSAPAVDPMTAAMGKIMDRLEAFETKSAVAAEEQNIYNALNPTGVGTAQDFDKFTQWAQGGGMTATQQAQLDAVLANGTPQDKIAMVSAYGTAMHASQANAAPQNNMVQGNLSQTPTATTPQGYMSAQDFATIMASEKFKTDPSYAAAMQTQRLESRKVYGK